MSRGTPRAALLIAAGLLALVGRPGTALGQGGDSTPPPVSPKLIVVGPGGTVHTEGDPPPAAPVRSISSAQAAALVRREQGRPRVVVFYGAACSRSKAMLPPLLDLARRGESSGATVFAFGVNGSTAAYAAFHAAIRTTHDPLRIRDHARGVLSGAMAPLGIAVPANGFELPLVAVLDPGGQVVGQWQVTSSEEMLAALQATAGVFGVGR